MISDLIMIVAGFWEKYLGSPWHEFFFAVSLVAFVITQMHFKVLLDLGASVLVNKMDRLKFRILSWYTLMVSVPPWTPISKRPSQHTPKHETDSVFRGWSSSVLTMILGFLKY